MSLKKIIYGGVCVLVLIGGGLYYSGYFPGLSGKASGTSQAQAARPPVPSVAILAGQAVRKDMPIKITAIGTVQPIASVSLRTRADAQISKILVSDGASVKAGDTLIELDSSQIVAQLAQSRATLAKDSAQLEQVQRDVARYTDLVARNATPALNLENANTAVTATKAQIDADTAAVNNLQVQLGWYTIKAPISGRVGVISNKAGNIVRAGDNTATGVLATINQITPIYVSFSVTQRYLQELRSALRDGIGTVYATPQGAKEPVKGKLAVVDNGIDQSTGTISVRAQFDNQDEKLWPGQLCDLSIYLAIEKDQVVVPREAVNVGQNGNFVFIINDDNTVKFQPVTIGRTQDGETIIPTGLTGSEKVVVDGALLLNNGSRITIKTPAAKSAS